SGVGSSDPDAAVPPGISSYEFTLDGAAPIGQALPSFPWTPTPPTVGDHTASLRVRDADGAWSTNLASVTISVIDTTAPVIVGGVTDIPVEATGPLTPISYVAPVFATDNAFPGILPVSCLPASGTPRAVGVHTITCTATDGSGNGAVPVIGTATVTDTTAPTIAPVDDFPVEATSAAGAHVDIVPPLATDLVDGSVASTCDQSSGDYPLGTLTVNCDYTDTAGNAAATESFDVTVQDTTGPTIEQPEDVVAEAVDADGAFVVVTPPATSDAVDSAGVATCDAESGVFAIGSVLVQCDATDAAGNAASPVFFTISVRDETAPVIQQGIPLFLTENAACTLAEGFACAYGAYITPLSLDLVDGDEDATCVPASGSAFPVGSNLVRCDDTDTAGNAALSEFFAVTVLDNENPVIEQLEDLTFEATGASGAAAVYALPVVGDVEDGNGVIVPSCEPVSGTLVALDTPTIVTCDAEDSAGFTDEMSFTVTVVDTTAPAIDAVSDVTVVATGEDGAPVDFSAPGWTDAVDGEGATDCVPASATTFPIGTTLVTCAVTDGHGNVALAFFDVNVVTSPDALEAFGGADFVGVLAGNGQLLRARVLDQAGNPVSGVTVDWAVLAGGGELSAASSDTDVDGVASVVLTTGGEAGLNVVEASSGALDGSPVTFTVETLSPGGFVDGFLISEDPWSAGADLGPRTGGQRVIVFLPEGGLVFALLFDFDPAWPGGDVTLVVTELGEAPFGIASDQDALGFYQITISVDGLPLDSTEGVLSGAAIGWRIPGGMVSDFTGFRTYRWNPGSPVESYGIMVLDPSGDDLLVASFVPGFSTFALGGTPDPVPDAGGVVRFGPTGGSGTTYLPKAHEPFSAFACVDSEICRLDTLAVRFRATSSDIDGEGLQYRWNFGDGGSSNDAAPTHTFPARGKYTVTLETDDGVYATRAFREVVAAPPLDLGLPEEVVLTVGENTFEVDPDAAVQTLRVLLEGRQLGPVFNRPFALTFEASPVLIEGIGAGAVLTIEATDDLGITYTGEVPVSAIVEPVSVDDATEEAQPPAEKGLPAAGFVSALATLGAVAFVLRRRR
ncbi:MAG TPA: HYR domain-containing protein, partial [Candidatus Thermoplasmatota archaeon]|nr:HYR domain-containing protein [Candidatus Thermoplasmatota archaeon]